MNSTFIFVLFILLLSVAGTATVVACIDLDRLNHRRHRSTADERRRQRRGMARGRRATDAVGEHAASAA